MSSAWERRLQTEAQLIVHDACCARLSMSIAIIFPSFTVFFNVGFNYDVIYCIGPELAIGGSRERSVAKTHFARKNFKEQQQPSAQASTVIYPSPFSAVRFATCSESQKTGRVVAGEING